MKLSDADREQIQKIRDKRILLLYQDIGTLNVFHYLFHLMRDDLPWLCDLLDPPEEGTDR